jgi:hypothetical protein
LCIPKLPPKIQDALIAIVTQETAGIEDANQRLSEAIELAIRLLGVPLEPVE